MHLTGKHELPAPAKKIWDLMMDPVVLARITPGITRLERIEGDNYKAIADIKIGPVSAKFSGTLQVVEPDEPHSFSLAIQQNSTIGNANALVAMRLQPTENGNTEVSFSGEVRMSGVMATMGQRVITPVAHLLTGQFFKALEEELKEKL